MPRVAFSPYTNARGNQSRLLSFVAAGTIAPLILPLIIAAFGRVTLDGPNQRATRRHDIADTLYQQPHLAEAARDLAQPHQSSPQLNGGRGTV